MRTTNFWTTIFLLEEIKSASSGREYLVGSLGNSKIIIKCKPGEQPWSENAINRWHAEIQPGKGTNTSARFELLELQEFVSKKGGTYLSGKFGTSRLIVELDKALKPKTQRGQAVWRAIVRAA